MRRIVWGVVLIAFVMLGGGCTSRNAQDKIQFATWGSKTEMSIITPIVENYNKTHSTKVEIIHIPQNYFHKIHLLFASNLAPDVIFINNLYLKVYQKAGLLEDLTPIIKQSDYFENALLTMSVDGRIYAVPRDVSSFVIFYNKDVFQKTGVKIPKNWDMKEFYSTAKSLQKSAELGFCSELESSSFENFISTSSKPIIYEGEITMGEKKSVEAMQRLADKINKEKIGANKEQLALSPCAQMFLNKKTGMFISGRWSVPKLDAEADFNYGVAPFPDDRSGFYIPLNASGWAVSKNSKNKEAAIDFVKYISSDENIGEITASGLITPAKKEVAGSDIFKNGKVFIDIIDKSTPNIVPDNYNILIDKINQKAASVLGGYKTAKEVFN